jgi:transaldolase
VQVDLKIKLFADGANLDQIRTLSENPKVAGFTTNPTLMKNAGVANYEKFAKDALEIIEDRPISFEVFSDDVNEMIKQALTISSWGKNIFIKIPITTTKGEFTNTAIKELGNQGVPLNITAILTPRQISNILSDINLNTQNVISVFAGRIADTGINPKNIMLECLSILKQYPGCDLLWASPREILNLIEADEIGCQIITMTPDLWKKMENLGKDLEEFSLDTVRMFYKDAQSAGYSIK